MEFTVRKELMVGKEFTGEWKKNKQSVSITEFTVRKEFMVRKEFTIR